MKKSNNNLICEAVKRVLYDHIKNNEKLTYIAIVETFNFNKGYSELSYSDICLILKIKNRNIVSNILNSLEQLGYIRIIRTDGKTNQYQVLKYLDFNSEKVEKSNVNKDTVKKVTDGDVSGDKKVTSDNKTNNTLKININIEINTDKESQIDIVSGNKMEEKIVIENIVIDTEGKRCESKNEFGTSNKLNTRQSQKTKVKHRKFKLLSSTISLIRGIIKKFIEFKSTIKSQNRKKN